jgi:hypothetical protein
LRRRNAAELLADRWIAEYGTAAAWHARRKIGELREWGDRDGARFCGSLLEAIERRAHAA